MLRATAVAFAIALALGAWLAYRAGWPLLLLALIGVLCGIWYTAGRYSLAYLGLGEPFVFVFFGPVAVGGTYYVQAQQLPWPILVAGMAPGLLSVSLLAVNNLRDIEQDELAGKRTLAVRFGRTFARWEYVLCIVLALLVPVVLWSTYGYPASVMGASGAGLVAVPACRIVWHQRGKALNRVLGMTALLLLVYSILFSLGLCWP
jgi:1,4-dihydroxy-2-naphthoate octaprenyltransferase